MIDKQFLFKLYKYCTYLGRKIPFCKLIDLIPRSITLWTCSKCMWLLDGGYFVCLSWDSGCNYGSMRLYMEPLLRIFVNICVRIIVCMDALSEALRNKSEILCILKSSERHLNYRTAKRTQRNKHGRWCKNIFHYTKDTILSEQQKRAQHNTTHETY